MSGDSTVFIVDDNEATLDHLKAVVSEDGNPVEAFSSAEAFLQAHQPGRTGCLVLDVQMPGMSGIELQKEMKARGIALPIIFITGHGDVPMAVQALKNGAHDFIEKPFDNRHLLVRIHSTMAAARHSEDIGYAPIEIRARMENLTPREREVMELVTHGNTNKGIAHILDISEKTVELHRGHMMDKMKSKTLAALVKMSMAAKSSLSGDSG